MNMSNSSDVTRITTQWEESLRQPTSSDASFIGLPEDLRNRPEARLDGLTAQLLAYNTKDISYAQFIKRQQKRAKTIRRGAKAKARASARAERCEWDPWSLPLPTSGLSANSDKPYTKLRLLVTDKCHNSCPLCCNRQYNLQNLPIVDKWDYNEIMITGGEPLMTNKKAHQLISLLDSIRSVWKAMGHTGVIYLYTASHRVDLIVKILKYVDGIVYTPHNLAEFHTLGNLLGNYRYMRYEGKRSLRLNVFKNQIDMLYILPNYARIRLTAFWSVKEIEWVPECPVPEGEEFRRLRSLY